MKSWTKRATVTLSVFPTLILFITIFSYSRNAYLKDFPSCDWNAKVVILVTSNAPNIDLRAAQRKAMSDDVLWRELRAVRVFLLAQHSDDSVMSQVMQENDVLLGDFEESYKNLAFKHLMGLSWAAANCHASSVVIKMDDDIAVDLISLAQKAMLDVRQGSVIAGWTHRRMPVRRHASKWALTKQEFAGEEFPDFVSGWAYATNLQTVQTLLNQAFLERNPLWIDDAWISGVVRQKSEKRIELIGWDLYFSPYTEHLQCCIKDATHWCDFLVLPSGSNGDLIEAFGQHALNCYLEQGCSKRNWSESSWNNCQVDNPLFLPETKGIGRVLMPS